MHAHKQQNQHQHTLPQGCHDADTAAQLLGLSKRELLRRMRELGWLKVGGGPSNHNLPRLEYTARGWLATQDRGYALKGKPEIARTYRVMLITQTGFPQLKKALEEQVQAENKPTPTTATTTADDDKPKRWADMTQRERDAADRERQRALAELRNMGITS